MYALAKTFRAAVIGAALTGPGLAAANGIAGDYLAARQAALTGDFEAAAHYYDRAIQFDPTNPELLERGVLSNISLGNVDRAAALADKMALEGFSSQLMYMALVAGDSAAENYTAVLDAIGDDRGVGPLADGLVEAWAQLGQGDMTAALLRFDEVAQKQGLGPFATYHKALALASVGDFESAEALYSQAAAGGMQMTRRGVMARAEILSQLDRTGEALALIETSFGAGLDPALSQMVSELEADDPLPFTHVRSARDGIAEVFFTVAGALSSEENDDLTLIYARLSNYLRPDHVDALLLSGELLAGMGRHALAVETYARVPVAHPAFHAAELGRAESLRRQGNPDAAIAVLEALTDSHGDLPVVLSSFADLLRAQERYAEAAEAYSAAIDRHAEITDRQWFLYYARGITYERQDMWQRAEADFRRALELDPGQPQVLNYLGYSLVEQQIKLDEALGMIEQAVSARPDSGYIVDSLGWVLYRLGRYKEAVPHMERAAELMPIDPVVNDHLGDVYWAVGRKLEAEFQWKRALSFAEWEDAAEEVDVDRIRRKLSAGLDRVLAEEGAPPLRAADAGAERLNDDG